MADLDKTIIKIEHLNKEFIVDKKPIRKERYYKMAMDVL